MRWLDEIKVLREEPKTITRQDLGKLIEEGMNIPPHALVENALAELQALMINIDNWEDKAKLYLQPTSNRQNLSVIEELISDADKIDAYLPALSNLKDVLNKAKNWLKNAQNMVGPREVYPYFDTVEDLIRKGRGIPVHLSSLPALESNLSQAKLWKERTSKTFLRKNSHYTLMQALSPRIGVGLPDLRNRKNRGDDSIGDVYICNTKLDDSNDPSTVVNAFKLAEQREMEAMRNLRDQNVQKLKVEGSRFCVCRRQKFGQMLRCELCKDWFHCMCKSYSVAFSVELMI